MHKKRLSNGQKSRQRTDTEDRAMVYRDWLRTHKSPNGFYLDADLIKWRTGDKGVPVPCAITEITRCDSEQVSTNYLRAIERRWFERDSQGVCFEELGRMLGVPVYIVLFQKELKWIYAFSFQNKTWKKFTPDEWELFLSNL